MMRHQCPICASSKTKPLHRALFDDRYGYPGKFDLVRCTECKHTFLDAAFSESELTHLYSVYYPRSALDLDRYAPRKEARGFSAWFNGERRSAYTWVPPGVRILDIGCGFCESLGYHKQRGCEAFGVEADSNAQRVAERYGLDVAIGLFNPDLYPPESFDYVTLDQVVEHVVNPHDLFSGVARVLKSGGWVILSTPNAQGWGSHFFGRRWINWHPPYHLHHFSPQSMQLCATKAGLYVERQLTITPSDWLFYQFNHLSTLPEPGRPSLYWTDTGNPGPFSVRLALLMARIFHKLGGNHVLTRVFDFLNIGDNRIFFLRKP